MKIIFSTLLLTAIIQNGVAQSDSSTLKSAKEKFRLIHANSVSKSKEGFLVCNGNVKVQIDGKLSIEADSVLHNRKGETIIAYRTQKFQFEGDVMVGIHPKGLLKYKLGDKILYIE